MATALDTRVFLYLAIPEIIHSDRGKYFDSELMQELCDLWGVQNTQTTLYHPQSNGVVESGNHTLGDSLRSLLPESRGRQGYRDLLLPYIMRLFKATPNATGESADYIMNGRELNLPGLLVYTNEESKLHTDFAVEKQAILEKVHDKIRAERWTQIQSHDARACMYKPGDFCLVDIRKRKKGVITMFEPTMRLFEGFSK